MQRVRQIISANVLPFLLIGYLVSDALWLLGDTPGLRRTTFGTALQLGAWLLAIAISSGAGVLLSKALAIGTIALRVAVTAFGAAIFVVICGLIFFPAQFPRDSDWDQILIWLLVASTAVVVLFAGIAALSAGLARRLR